jgi:hypothetical protein
VLLHWTAKERKTNMDDTNRDGRRGETGSPDERKDNSIGQDEVKTGAASDPEADVGRRALIRSGWAIPVILSAELSAPEYGLAGSGVHHSDAHHTDAIHCDLHTDTPAVHQHNDIVFEDAHGDFGYGHTHEDSHADIHPVNNHMDQPHGDNHQDC